MEKVHDVFEISKTDKVTTYKWNEGGFYFLKLLFIAFVYSMLGYFYFTRNIIRMDLFLAVIAVLTVLSILFLLWGRHRLQLSENKLVYSKGLGYYFPFLARKISGSSIAKLDTSINPFSSEANSDGDWTVLVYLYDKSRCRIGRDLLPDQARFLLSEIERIVNFTKVNDPELLKRTIPLIVPVVLTTVISMLLTLPGTESLSDTIPPRGIRVIAGIFGYIFVAYITIRFEDMGAKLQGARKVIYLLFSALLTAAAILFFYFREDISSLI